MEWRQTGIDFSFISLFVALLRFIRLGNFHQFPSTIIARLSLLWGAYLMVSQSNTKEDFNELSWFLFAIHFHQLTCMKRSFKKWNIIFDGIWIWVYVTTQMEMKILMSFYCNLWGECDFDWDVKMENFN